MNEKVRDRGVGEGTVDVIDIMSALIAFSAVFSFVNYKYFRLPRTIGLMLFALILSWGVLIAGQFGWGVEKDALRLLGQLDFNRLLLQGMLGFLLFGGALDVELNELMKQKWVVLALATFGVILSTFLVAGMVWVIFYLLGLSLAPTYCLLFGALISPTDPVAVLDTLKRLKAPKGLQTQMAGEALFNDGVGVVVFIVLLRIAAGEHGASVSTVGLLLSEEALGGILFGLVAGVGAYQMLKRVDNYQVEVLITLGLVSGGYALANSLHTSGPLAMVVAGLLIGNHGRAFAMSEITRKNLDTFWELMGEILNALLFMLIGLEILAVEFTLQHLLAGVMVIPLVLFVRMVSVGLLIGILGFRSRFSPHVVKTLTWGGLRGGIAVALALSLPQGPSRDAILVLTYMVVVFSVAVQGLTIERFLKRWNAAWQSPEPEI
jgi:CPA1 family monovalent cation:H+ antiporter